MIISSDGYYLSYDKMRNYIMIHLPQTAETAENTIEKLLKRRTNVNQSELALILNLVKYVFNLVKEEEDDEIERENDQNGKGKRMKKEFVIEMEEECIDCPNLELETDTWPNFADGHISKRHQCRHLLFCKKVRTNWERFQPNCDECGRKEPGPFGRSNY